jgi:putative transposase
MTGNILRIGEGFRLIGDERCWILDEVSNGGVAHIHVAEVSGCEWEHRDLRLAELYRLLGPATGPAGLELHLQGDWPDFVVQMAAHVREAFYGTPRDGSEEPRAAYDPATTTVKERLASKRQELAGTAWAGPSPRGKSRRRVNGPSPATLHRYRQDLEMLHGGLAALDARMNPQEGARTRTANVDPALLAIIDSVVRGQTRESTVKDKGLIARVRQRTVASGLGIALPSDRTLRRHLADRKAKLYTTGRATSRRSAANSPTRVYSRVETSRPGGLVEVDSTSLDVMIRGETKPYRAHVTVMLDVATGVVVAWAFHPEAPKAVDHTTMLAHAIVGRHMTPGWPQTSLDASLTLPVEIMKKVFEVFNDDSLALPYIFPEELTLDGGMDFRAELLKEVALMYGITLNLAAPGTPTQKPHIERFFGTVHTDFSSFLAGHTGGNPEDRGKKVLPVLTLPQLNILWELWLTTVYIHTPSDGLRLDMYPGLECTPAQMYAALFRAAGGVRVPYGPDDFVNLLPAVERVISDEGVQHANRHYMSSLIVPLRDRQSTRPSGDWLIHYDPYDPVAVFMHHPDTGEVITLIDRSLNAYNTPLLADASDFIAAGGAPADPNLEQNRTAFIDTAKLFKTQGRREAARQRQRDKLPRPQVAVPRQPVLLEPDDLELPDPLPLWDPESSL